MNTRQRAGAPKRDSRRSGTPVAWAVAAALSVALPAGLLGCGKESDGKKETPPAATQPGAPPAPVQADPGGGRIGELEAQYQAAADELAAVRKEHDAALAKANKEAQASENFLRGQLADERKATAEVEAKLANMQSTLMALRQRLWDSGQADWVVRAEAEAFESPKDVQVKDYAQASGGKAVLFDKPTSAAETVIAVKPGTYRVVPVGMSPDGGDHDALDLTVKALDKETGAIDIRQRVFFDEKFDEFVGASNSPQIVVAREGKLKVGLKVDEETGAIVDRVEVRVHVPIER